MWWQKTVMRNAKQRVINKTFVLELILSSEYPLTKSLVHRKKDTKIINRIKQNVADQWHILQETENLCNVKGRPDF
jgi:hypothetical protein